MMFMQDRKEQEPPPKYRSNSYKYGDRHPISENKEESNQSKFYSRLIDTSICLPPFYTSVSS